MATCPLCDQEAALSPDPKRSGATACHCPICGSFLFSAEAGGLLQSAEIKDRRYLISAYTRRMSDSGEPARLLGDSLAALLESAVPPRTPYDVLDPLLLAIHDATRAPRDFAYIPYDDYPRYVVRDRGDLHEFVLLLAALHLVEIEPSGDPTSLMARLTMAGWERVAALRAGGRSSGRAFVAMSFATDLKPLYDSAIAPALEDAGWRPVRIDRVAHNDRIDDRIIVELRRSGLVVADFTGHRQGVYFEAGFAAGLGLPVIYTVRKSDLKDVHFDTRQYNHIVWEDLSELRESLRLRVLATAGPPARSERADQLSK